MNELLKALSMGVVETQKLIDSLVKVVNLANSLKKESDEKIAKALSKESENTRKADELAERENAVKRIENIVKLSEDAKALAKQNEEISAKLENMKTAFNTSIAAKLKEVSARTKKNLDYKIELDKEWAIFKKRETALKEMEDNYKDRIAKNIVKGA